MWKIRRFIESISNLVWYFRVVWNDHDWDHSYIHDILLRKLEKVLKRYQNAQYVGDQEKDINKPLRICVEILRRDRDGFYLQTKNAWKRKDEGYTSNFDLRESETTALLYRILGKYVMYWWD